MPAVEIPLIPNQRKLLKELRTGTHSVIGVGGGRGSSKSSGADRCILTLMAEFPGIKICLVMRTWVAQVVPFHIEPIKTEFPWVASDLKVSPPAVLRIGKSSCEFKYAQNYDQVEEAFRSGNYNTILIDQAEQFTLKEITEIRKACRSILPKFPIAKLVLLFNMRGSCIQDLRKMFHLKEVGDPEDYIFFKFDPWDNYYWVQEALKKDGYSVIDYYRWTDDQRKEYAALKGPYTKTLFEGDPVISKADWEGSWDTVEGAYFANSFDLEAVRLNPNLVDQIQKPWANYWLSGDWGEKHYTAILWHYRIALKPTEAAQYLGWTGLTKPINLIVTYREMCVNERTTTEVGRLIVESTPAIEKPLLHAFYLSPECVTEDPNSVGSQIGKELRPAGLPLPIKADNDRKGGYTLMEKLLKAAKFKGVDPNGIQYEDAWLISSECPQLLAALPILMRDPNNLDSVLKTDLSTAKIEQDISEACFAAGTMIWTRRGQVPIEQVTTNDYVMTRKGWRRIRRSWLNRKNARVVKATFSDGTEIVCTPEHKFHTDKGWLSLDTIRYGDIITSQENVLLLVELQGATSEDVYDLEVEDAHEFYANGLLVHNCRYGLKSMLAPKKKTEQDIFNEAMNAATPAQRMTLAWAHAQKKSKPKKQFLPPSWQSGRK